MHTIINTSMIPNTKTPTKTAQYRGQAGMISEKKYGFVHTGFKDESFTLHHYNYLKHTQQYTINNLIQKAKEYIYVLQFPKH